MVVKDESSSGEKPLDLFLKIGLDERTAKNTVANKKVTANLTNVIQEAAVTDGCDRTTGNLLYTVATKFPANALVHRPTLLQYIVSSKIITPAQLEAAFSFFATTGSENFKINEFEEACGVDAYSKVLMPQKGLTDKLKKSLTDMTTLDQDDEISRNIVGLAVKAANSWTTTCFVCCRRTDELVDGPNASHIAPTALDRRRYC